MQWILGVKEWFSQSTQREKQENENVDWEVSSQYQD